MLVSGGATPTSPCKSNGLWPTMVPCSLFHQWSDALWPPSLRTSRSVTALRRQVPNVCERRCYTHIPMQIQWAVPDHGAMVSFPAAERGRWAAVAADFKGRHGIEVVTIAFAPTSEAQEPITAQRNDLWCE